MTFLPPGHLAVIMDGNGRWAKARGLDRFHGHIQGVESIRRTVELCIEHGIKYLTLYAFSTENWGRPDEEVNGLMELLCKCTVNEVPELKKQGVRVRFIGDLDILDDKVRESIENSHRETRDNDKLHLMLAVNYGSRAELTSSLKEIANMVIDGDLAIDDITSDLISEKLYTSGIPDPDLIIRTSGECRLSNFLLWQAAYSEFYFTDVLWPDFGREEFERAIENYKKRTRRFGLVHNK
ncbi:MAG: isoprenyl transferase [Rikenellaceae bacterium]|nr:isoprenyl transferase [Rikenellaceae bacterium]